VGAGDSGVGLDRGRTGFAVPACGNDATEEALECAAVACGGTGDGFPACVGEGDAVTVTTEVTVTVGVAVAETDAGDETAATGVAATAALV
jgi:hypothetical protein